MPRLTPRAQAFIKKYPDMSSRRLALLIYGNLHEQYSHTAVNDYQRKLKQTKASNLVHIAIKNGELIKPTICEHCGTPTEDIIAHHEDYDKPLKVDWLCRTCHLTTYKHKLSKAAKKGHENRKISESLQTLRKNYPKSKTQKVETNAFPSVKEVVAFTKNITKTKLTFSEFMAKLERSDSYSAKRLREKLNIRGKHRQINLDRILRIIQYVVDVVQE